jgi:uncharacterized cupin superfamily protein
MPQRPAHIVNVSDAEEQESLEGAYWGQRYQPLTPALDALPGRLGVNLTHVPAGRTSCPFHTHLRDDEVFYVLSGRGMLRYGEAMDPIGPGDCISCPAGTGTAHQFVNPFAEDLVFLAIGGNDPHEVCTYPDSGKVLVRGLKAVGYLRSADYLDGEPERPRIFDLLPDGSESRGTAD